MMRYYRTGPLVVLAYPYNSLIPEHASRTFSVDDLPIEISCAATKAKIDDGEDLFLLDCRERDEHSIVSIGSAVLIPMSELQDRVGELAEHRNRQFIVHCHLGGRSLQVAAWLRQQGFARAQSMTGGIDCWAQEIDPSLDRY